MVMLGPKHILFDSVEEMLAPKTLTGLLSKPDCQPMIGHVGFAGSQLSSVNTNANWLKNTIKIHGQRVMDPLRWL
jgi:hypothetical protein